AIDRLRTLTYPDDNGTGRETLTFAYGTHKLLTGVTSSLGTTLLGSAHYNALGQPIDHQLGSGGTMATQTYTYYGLTATGNPYGALGEARLQVGAADRYRATRSYDVVGNVARVVDSVNGETTDFAYDDLDRLTQASNAFAESYAYSAIGNMTSKGGLPL